MLDDDFELEEAREFWDDFAFEYTEIQNESQIQIVDDLGAFLAKDVLTPVETLIDLAGGSGKYLPALVPLSKRCLFVDFSDKMIALAKEKTSFHHIEFLTIEQNEFLRKTESRTYDIVFSAMNPAIRTKSDLDQIIRIAKQRVYLLRTVKNEDSLFSPFEAADQTLGWLSEYKSWLKRPYESHLFTYFFEEVVSKDFFQDYFKEELTPERLSLALEQFFSTDETVINRHQITFELLIIRINH